MIVFPHGLTPLALSTGTSGASPPSPAETTALEPGGAKSNISKRMRRVLANRASAARSKDRKRTIEELEKQVSAACSLAARCSDYGDTCTMRWQRRAVPEALSGSVCAMPTSPTDQVYGPLGAMLCVAWIMTCHGRWPCWSNKAQARRRRCSVCKAPTMHCVRSEQTPNTPCTHGCAPLLRQTQICIHELRVWDGFALLLRTVASKTAVYLSKCHVNESRILYHVQCLHLCHSITSMAQCARRDCWRAHACIYDGTQMRTTQELSTWLFAVRQNALLEQQLLQLREQLRLATARLQAVTQPSSNPQLQSQPLLPALPPPHPVQQQQLLPLPVAAQMQLPPLPIAPHMQLLPLPVVPQMQLQQPSHPLGALISQCRLKVQSSAPSCIGEQMGRPSICWLPCLKSCHPWHAAYTSSALLP